MGFKFKSLVKAVTGLVKDVGKVVGGDVLDDALGLDSLGGAVEDAFRDLSQVIDVLSGSYHNDMKKLQERQKSIESKLNTYNKDVSKLENDITRLLAFEEIFKMSASNRLDAYTNKYGAEIDTLIEEYKVALRSLQNEYDFVIGLTEGSFLEKIVGSMIMIAGGLQSDIYSAIGGNADGATWKRLITVTVMVITITLLLLIPGTQGAAISLATQVAITLTVINTLMSLDSMYANGAATGAIMGALDTLFNDVLNLDSLIGRDFDKFDKDHDDYQEMVMYTQLALAVAAMYAGWVSTPDPTSAQIAGPSVIQEFVSTETGFVAAESSAGQTALSVSAASTTSSYAEGFIEINKANMKSSTLAGVKFSTYSDIYKAYTTATEIKDVVSANEQYEAMKDKLREDQLKLEEAIASKLRKGFTKSYTDMAYFLQDQQEAVDRYIWSMTSQNMYVDPYGTTPVANIRFIPDKDTRVLSFGFEELFDENKMAGSSGYFKNILYGG